MQKITLTNIKNMIKNTYNQLKIQLKTPLLKELLKI